MRKTTTLLGLLLCLAGTLLAEGTKQIMPASNNPGPGNPANIESDCISYVQGNDGSGKEGSTVGRPGSDKLKVWINDPTTETIFFGFRKHIYTSLNVTYYIKDPAGNTLCTGVVVSSGEGYIEDDQIEAYVGPQEIYGGSSGGYDAMECTPNLAGEYIIEFEEATNAKYYLHPFDITVGKEDGMGGYDAVEGRLYSQKWHLNANGGSNKSCIDFYAYTPDSTVIALDLNGMQPWGYSVSFNSTGPGSSGDILADRKSTTSNTITPDYPIFLNDPDSIVWATGNVIVDLDLEYLSGCLTVSDFCFYMLTNSLTEFNVYIDLDGNGVYDSGGIDVYFPYKNTNTGRVCIPWDGLDGQGNSITGGTNGKIIIEALAGLVHFPVWDAENHVNGYNVSLIRPQNLPAPQMYWDNTNISLGTAPYYNFDGCANNCNTWSGNVGNNRLVNTWMYSIADSASFNFSISTTNCDLDDDGIDDNVDIDNDNDGIPDVAEMDCNPSCVDRDTDNDGIIDRFDLDSDNDGIPDIVEAGGTDNNNDGQVDYATPGDPSTIVDLDNDGLADAYDDTDSAGATPGWSAGTDIPNADSDGDGLADAIDLDSDNDGLVDLVEVGGTDSDNNGQVDDMVNPLTGDANYDGWSDATDSSPLVDVSLTNDTNVDHDGDGHPNHLDLDSDNDALPDIVETGGVDTDGDGKVDNLEPDGSLTNDRDGDGLADGYDPVDTQENTSGWMSGVASSTPNTDGTSKADYLDLDSDDDGIPDLIEASGIDTDGDGQVDTATDSDGDGFADVADPEDDGPNAGTGNTGTPFITTNNSGNWLAGVAGNSLDRDGDSYPDGLDLDADNDAIPDLVEVGGIDTDGDGRVDAAYATDTDGDGYADTYDSDDNSVVGDADGGTPTVITDGMGALLDGQDASSLDTDGDGHADYLDLDADNDGIPDFVEIGGPDYTGIGGVDTGLSPWDEDGDGLADLYDQNASDGPAGMGINGIALVKTSADIGGDGQVSVMGESMVAGSSNNAINQDNDAVPNHLDLDADNDGIVDLVEVGGVDTNNDGMVDDLVSNDSDNNGWLDSRVGTITTTNDGADGNPYVDYATGANQPDFDGDGQPNYLDIDADNDGIVDNTEAQTTAGYIAPTTDSDGDGLNDAYEVVGTIGSFGGVGIDPTNSDMADQTDYLDLDADNDGEMDTVEGHDSDNDGTADSGSTANTGLATGVDSDFDGLDDGFDNDTATSDPTNGSANPAAHPDTDAGLSDQDWRATNQNISGRVWEDSNQNGVLEDGEPRVSGATVKVFDNTDTEIATQTSGSDGSYLFTDLPIGTYYVVFTRPIAFDFGSPQDAGAATDQTDSDADANTGTTGNYAITMGGAEIYISAGFFMGPVPVELVSFGATSDQCEVQLHWTIANMENFSHFVVERSADGQRFKDLDYMAWDARERSTSFGFWDEKALPQAFYRLKMIDLDGQYSYSEVIAAQRNCEASLAEAQIFPNPISQGSKELNLSLPGINEEILIQVYNHLGQLLQQHQVDLYTDHSLYKLKLDQLGAGNYYLSLQSTTQTQTLPLLIID